MKAAFACFRVFLHSIDVRRFVLGFLGKSCDGLSCVFCDAFCVCFEEKDVACFFLGVTAAFSAVVAGEREVFRIV